MGMVKAHEFSQQMKDDPALDNENGSSLKEEKGKRDLSAVRRTSGLPREEMGRVRIKTHRGKKSDHSKRACKLTSARARGRDCTGKKEVPRTGKGLSVVSNRPREKGGLKARKRLRRV